MPQETPPQISPAIETLQALSDQVGKIERVLTEQAAEGAGNEVALAFLSVVHHPYFKVDLIEAAGDSHLRFSGLLPDGSALVVVQHVSLTALVFRFDTAQTSRAPRKRVRLEIHGLR